MCFEQLILIEYRLFTVSQNLSVKGGCFGAVGGRSTGGILPSFARCPGIEFSPRNIGHSHNVRLVRFSKELTFFLQMFSGGCSPFEQDWPPQGRRR